MSVVLVCVVFVVFWVKLRPARKKEKPDKLPLLVFSKTFYDSPDYGRRYVDFH